MYLHHQPDELSPSVRQSLYKWTTVSILRYGPEIWHTFSSPSCLTNRSIKSKSLYGKLRDYWHTLFSKQRYNLRSNRSGRTTILYSYHLNWQIKIRSLYTLSCYKKFTCEGYLSFARSYICFYFILKPVSRERISTCRINNSQAHEVRSIQLSKFRWNVFEFHNLDHRDIYSLYLNQNKTELKLQRASHIF